MHEVLIIGAGEAGKMVAREILDSSKLSKNYHLVGFLDDDKSKKSLLGVPVLGSLNQIHTFTSSLKIDLVIIAIPSAEKEVITKLMALLSNSKVEIKIVPGIHEIIQGSVSWKQIRPIKPEDLLGREEVGFDEKELENFYLDKTIFITGAGGSIGSEIVRQILKLPIKKIFGMGRGENSIHQLLIQHSNEPRFNYIIGDSSDDHKIKHELLKVKPHIVFHAAAHKHVPLMEEYPEEAVKNNVLGSYATAKAALEAKVQTFVFVSTDKAVNPSSIMGCTKRLAEKIILSLNQEKQTRFLCTRFGNVLGSRGSVIPTFLAQIKKGGPITVTHPDMERFFMSIPEAARLVVKSGCTQKGDIFVLNMGKAVKILDLAKNLIRLSGHEEEDIPITFSGVRKGEKIYEELFSNKKNIKASEFDKLMYLEKSPEIFDLKELEEIKKAFLNLCANFDKKGIYKLLEHYVPEFSPNKNK